MTNSQPKNCRVCGARLSAEPLLHYPNMPGVAQHLPDASTIDGDRGVDLDIFLCAGCGLVQLDAEPVPYYREVIRAAGVSPEMTEFRMAQFGEFVRRHNLAGKKVLEAGCGRGEYLGLMAQQGTLAYGLEYSADAVRESAGKGLRAIQGFIEREGDRIPEGPFDAFFMISFFEHLPNPIAALRGIRNNLRDGAAGLVEVPNFEMMLRERLFSEFMRDHLFYFTKRTLATTLELGGFEVDGIEEVWHQYILSATVRKRPAPDLSDFKEYQDKIRRELEAFLKRFPRTAIWGAGHQAFAIMAMMRLGGRIRYVLDSAVFKQGKLTPASHIPIVAPETLDRDPVDAVIVMAGSYSDEVRRIIRSRFSPHLSVAVLREHGLETDHPATR